MNEYMTQVFAVTGLVGVLSLLAYRGKSDPSRLALGVILIYTVISPLASMSADFNINDIISNAPAAPEGEYGVVLEEAFAEGIRLAVAEKFSLVREDIRVSLNGFDESKMRAERIRIMLSGRATLADYKRIEKYINELGVGECDCEIEIG